MTVEIEEGRWFIISTARTFLFKLFSALYSSDWNSSDELPEHLRLRKSSPLAMVAIARACNWRGLAKSLFFCGLIGAIGVSGSAFIHAQTVPRACTEISRETLPGGLADGQTGVIARDIPFVLREGQYIIKTLSDTAPSGRTRSEQCFRYEAENTGSGDIRQFYWPLAGINIDPFKAGRPRASRVQVRPILESPIDIVSSVFAFENERSETRAWAERQYREGTNQAWASESPRMALIKPDIYLAGLSDFLQKAKLPSESFLAVYLNTSGAEAPTLHDQYSSSGLNIDISSNAVRIDKSILIQTTMKITGESAGGLQYSIPALRTWDKFGNSLANLNAYSEFVSVFGNFKRESEKNRAIWTFKKSVSVESTVGGVIYRMDHPIYALGEGRRECIIVASYAPAPLSFDLGSCRP